MKDTKTSGARLDDQELLHLALRASNENRHEDAIKYLKDAIELAPKNAKAHYMLGAEHAEIGLYDRAAEEMAHAVKLDPSLVTASFQLGLLHITSGRVAEAEEAWKVLDKLGDGNSLYLFKKGMLHLTRDEFDAATEALKKGISLNTMNEALNRDMLGMLKQIESRPSAAAPSPAPPA
ncbi:MAG TPA: tetratricopeptide repeat protein, partial [Burkholderiales bacterium]|nr:tetratricopeptide repeat protein [Burkholderiales bacterium]